MCPYYHEQSSLLPSVVCTLDFGKSFSTGQLLLLQRIHITWQGMTSSELISHQRLGVNEVQYLSWSLFCLPTLPASSSSFQNHRVKPSFALVYLHPFTSIASTTQTFPHLKEVLTPTSMPLSSQAMSSHPLRLKEPLEDKLVTDIKCASH